MSAAMIPFEIEVEIMKRVVPVKSLIRFRSLSKEWKSVIDSSEFITDHNRINQAQPHHLLITYKDRLFSEVKYVSIVDDDSFPHHKSCPTVSPTVGSQLGNPLMIGCSHGLVCLRGSNLFVIWNPSIRKSVDIALPPHGVRVVFGFWVCPKTSDPMIVVIPGLIGYEAKADVFTLSSGAWRSISINLPHEFFIFLHTPVVIDGLIYWAAYDADDAYSPLRIISFDLTTDKFGQVDLPNCLARYRHMDISKLNQTLVVLDYYPTGCCDVWMMLKNGAFTKLFTIKVRPNRFVGFRKNGVLITDLARGRYGELQVCEPGSEHMDGLGIYGSLFDMASYTESLLLLNHSDSLVQQPQ